jgi:DMSO/TMAO reductase YedYZ molybdopterin-dependent catalytic subunit
VHFYAGLASIPFLVAHLAAVGVRFAGYYLRIEPYHAAGPPAWPRRLLGPVLAADFFVLYGSGLYMLFHVYYHTTNIPPLGLFPVQTHLWAAILAVPLISAHVGIHLADVLRGLHYQRRRDAQPTGPRRSGAVASRRAVLGTVALGAMGLAIALQNTRLQRGAGPFFISRLPPGESEGPGAFPIETLFGVDTTVDAARWGLRIHGEVDNPLTLTYDQLLALPAIERRIRLSCVSGWTASPVWKGPRVRDVLALAGTHPDARGVRFTSLTRYALTWRRDRVETDDALLATHVNGAPLSAYHGFPVRLIVPGYPGQNMIKQLSEIAVHPEAASFDPNFHLVSNPTGCLPDPSSL